MEIPCEIGCSPIGDLTYAERAKDMLKRLQGVGGYASDEESNRVLELLSWAYALGYTTCTLDAQLDNTFAQLATELLADHEHCRQIPNDGGARSILERQRRIVAIESASLEPGAANLIAALLRLGLASVSGLTQDRAAILAEGSEADAIFQIAIVLTAADYASPKRAAVADLLRRYLPSAGFGQLQHVSPEELLVTDIDAKWASTTRFLGRTAIGSGGAFTQQRTPSRIKSYSGTSRLAARDLNAIQELTLLGVASGADVDAQQTIGEQIIRAVSFSVGAGATVEVLAGGLSYTTRLARVAVRYNTTDIRPGQAGDTGLNASTYFERLWYTGPGGAAYDLTIAGVGRFLASGGKLEFENTSGSTQRLVVWIEMSGSMVGGGISFKRALTTFVDEQTLGASSPGPVNKSWWDTLRAAIAVRAGDGAAADAWTAFPTTQYGGLHRHAVIGHTIQPGSLAKTYVIDATEDWRDRIFLVEASIAHFPDNSDAFFPGAPRDHAFSTLPAIGSFIGYTGSGVTTGLAALQNYHVDLEGGLRIGARSSDGALVVEHTSSFGGDAQDSAILAIHATDQIAKRSSAVALNMESVSADGTSIEPSQLNWPQDIAVLTQGRGNAPASGFAQIPADAMPLGPLTRGTPRIPFAFSVRRRDGIANQPPVERRQGVAGALRRIFDLDIANGLELVVDDAYDWRDRFLHGFCTYATTDIRVGGIGANENDVGDVAAQTRLATYTGSGRPTGAYVAGQYILSVNGTSLFLYARDTDGALMIRNATGGTRYVVAWLAAGFRLGPRG